MDKRTKSLAQHEESHAAVQIDKTCAQMTWTLQDQRSEVTSGISIEAFSTMDHTPHIPRLPSYTVCQDQ